MPPYPYRIAERSLFILNKDLLQEQGTSFLSLDQNYLVRASFICTDRAYRFFMISLYYQEPYKNGSTCFFLKQIFEMRVASCSFEAEWRLSFNCGTR